MELRRIDLADDVLLRRWYDIEAAAQTFERPWSAQWSFEELCVMVRNQDESTRVDLLGAFEDAAMVGAGVMNLPLLDNVGKVYAGVFVEPEQRRRGIGRGLVEHTVALAHAEGRTEILVSAGVPGKERETHPYTVFALKNGFTMTSVEVHRVLDLPLAVSDVKTMQAECAPHHTDYELRTFHDQVPDELLESYCYLSNQLALDAPSGDVEFEAEAMTPDLYLKHVARMRQSGRHQLTTLAITRPGEAVAVTDLAVPRKDKPKVQQWATLVRRDHRGHHLGAAVKLQNLLELQARYPERTEIHTTNEESNDTMIGINERLGFRVVEVCPDFQRKL